MDFNEVISKRYSVRKFTDEKVPQEIIEEILEFGRIAPSGDNRQPTVVYVLDEEKIGKIKENPLIKIHPVFFKSKQALLVCYSKTLEMKRTHDKFCFGITDSSIATTYMMLKITELGLGSVWIGWFNPKLLKETLEIPDEYEPASILTFGYIHKSCRPYEKHNIRKPMEHFKQNFKENNRKI